MKYLSSRQLAHAVGVHKNKNLKHVSFGLVWFGFVAIRSIEKSTKKKKETQFLRGGYAYVSWMTLVRPKKTKNGNTQQTQLIIISLFILYLWTTLIT